MCITIYTVSTVANFKKENKLYAHVTSILRQVTKTNSSITMVLKCGPYHMCLKYWSCGKYFNGYESKWQH